MVQDSVIDMCDWEVSVIELHDTKFPQNNKELTLKNKKEVTVSPPTN